MTQAPPKGPMETAGPQPATDGALAFPLAEAWTAAARAWLDLPFVLYADLARFGAGRLHAQSDFLRRLGRCHTADDVITATTDFAQDSVFAGADEADRLLEDIAGSVAAGKAA